MAQKNTAGADNTSVQDKSINQRRKILELQTSIPRQDHKPPDSLHNSSSLSPAERYITQQSQMVFDLNDSASGTSSISSTTSSNRHAEKMNEWREKQISEVYKQEPYRYKYGTPSKNSTFRRTEGETNPYNTQTSNSSSSINRKTKK